MLLKEYLSKNFIKAQLIEYARILEVNNYSGLRKDALLEKIAKAFCNQEMLRIRTLCLTDVQLKLFREACKEPIAVPSNESINFVVLEKYLLGSFEKDRNKFFVFEDVADTFYKIDDEAFKSIQPQNGWLTTCLSFFRKNYGIGKPEIIYKMYTQKFKCESVSEILTMILYFMPDDITRVKLVSMDDVGLKDLSKNHNLYSNEGLIVSVDLLKSGKLDEFISRQKNNEINIPSVEDIYK